MIQGFKVPALPRLFLSMIVLFAATPPRIAGQNSTLRIAAAADLRSAMDDLTKSFEQQTHTEMEAAYGSSGNLFSQIVNGAPFDLFFSADLEYPRKLDQAGLVEPGSLYKYAVGQIVLWTPSGASVDVTREHWRALSGPSINKIAIANPEHAPYGRAAVSALQHAGIYDQVRAKLVYGENVSQAAQFVQSGNAQVGIIAKSLALSPAMRSGKYWDIPAGIHPPVEQAAVVLKTSANKDQARAFLAFVRSSAGRTVLTKYGFTFLEGQDSAR